MCGKGPLTEGWLLVEDITIPWKSSRELAVVTYSGQLSRAGWKRNECGSRRVKEE